MNSSSSPFTPGTITLKMSLELLYIRNNTWQRQETILSVCLAKGMSVSCELYPSLFPFIFSGDRFEKSITSIHDFFGNLFFIERASSFSSFVDATTDSFDQNQEWVSCLLLQILPVFVNRLMLQEKKLRWIRTSHDMKEKFVLMIWQDFL